MVMSTQAESSKRFPVDGTAIGDVLFKEKIPVHMKHWLFAMGTTPFILFPIQIITGLMLAFYFIPSPELAYESVRHITQDVQLGFWIRGIHHWAANLMIISIFLHMMRVYFTQAYRKPRELNWIFGFILLGLTMTISFTGYSLTYNQLSYWAATVGSNMVGEVPLIGNLLLAWLRGGSDVGTNTLTRFYTLHVWVLPILITIMIALHIIVLRGHGISQPEGFPKESYNFFPGHMYKIVIVGLFLLSLLSLLAVILPPGIGDKADPVNTPLHIQPEWYFFAVFLFLKWVPLSVGLFIVGLVILVIVFWPFLEPLLSKKESQRALISYLLGSVAILTLIVFTLIETFTN